MYTALIAGAAVSSAVMMWAACFICKCKSEYKQALEEDNKDICREITFATWLNETDMG